MVATMLCHHSKLERASMAATVKCRVSAVDGGCKSCAIQDSVLAPRLLEEFVYHKESSASVIASVNMQDNQAHTSFAPNIRTEPVHKDQFEMQRHSCSKEEFCAGWFNQLHGTCESW